MTESHEDEDRGPEGEKDPAAGADAQPEKPVEFGAGEGPAEADSPGAPEVEPGLGGYAGRDPKTEMPMIPTVPETQDDPKSHDAAPSDKTSEPPASN